PVPVGRKDHTRRIPRTCLRRRPALDSSDCAQLPTPEHLVDDAAMIQEPVTLAEWKRVENRRHKAMRNVERGVTVVAVAATRVLRNEIVSRTANRASIVERLRPGIAEQGSQSGSKTLADLGAEAVIIPDAVILQELNSGSAELRVRETGDNRCSAGKRLRGV